MLYMFTESISKAIEKRGKDHGSRGRVIFSMEILGTKQQTVLFSSWMLGFVKATHSLLKYKTRGLRNSQVKIHTRFLITEVSEPYYLERSSTMLSNDARKCLAPHWDNVLLIGASKCPLCGLLRRHLLCSGMFGAKTTSNTLYNEGLYLWSHVGQIIQRYSFNILDTYTPFLGQPRLD
jgi:hypothetical protein